MQLTTAFSPVVAYAAEEPFGQEIPTYDEIKALLEEDVVVTAEDHEIVYGSRFDVTLDFTGITIPDEEKVRVKFQQALNEEGESFSTEQADTYEAVYYVEPLTTDHPTYQISRNLIVKEPVTEEVEVDLNESSSDSKLEMEEAVEDEETDPDPIIEEMETVSEIRENVSEMQESVSNVEDAVALAAASDEDPVPDKFKLVVDGIHIAPDALRSGDASTTYKTVVFYGDDGSKVTRLAYCIQPKETSPGGGTVYEKDDIEILDGNTSTEKKMMKAMLARDKA